MNQYKTFVCISNKNYNNYNNNDNNNNNNNNNNNYNNNQPNINSNFQINPFSVINKPGENVNKNQLSSEETSKINNVNRNNAIKNYESKISFEGLPEKKNEEGQKINNQIENKPVLVMFHIKIMKM